MSLTNCVECGKPVSDQATACPQCGAPVPSNENSDSKTVADEIIAEMSECREDERNAQNQMFQVIATACTVLTFIFGASIFTEVSKNILFFLSNLIFCAAIGYIATLGINNVLRYHYLQNLEDQLSVLIPSHVPGEKMIHWMSFSAPITTRNLKHLKPKYTKMHFACYIVALICLVLFCGFLTIFQYISLDKYSIFDKAGIGILIIVFLFALVSFFYITIKAKKMYNFALKQAQIRRNHRLQVQTGMTGQTEETDDTGKRTGKAKGKIGAKEIFQIVSYFIYPKKKDLQKPILLIFGFLTGLFLQNSSITFGSALKQVVITFLVLDFFIYQARYQWNDIRGLKEDMEAGKTDRLPAHIMGKRPAVVVSMVTLALKLIMAVVMIVLVGDPIAFPLLFCAALIMIIAVWYEAVRTKKRTGSVFFVVSLGYPLRFFAGLWVAHPEIWNINLHTITMLFSRFASFLRQIWEDGIGAVSSTTPQIPVLLLLLAAYTFWGEFSVLLAWTQEAIAQKKSGKASRKRHYEFLVGKVACINREKPLSCSENGKLSQPWNWTYILSTVLLSGVLIFCTVPLFGSGWVLILATEICTLLISCGIIIFTGRTRNICIGLFCMAVIAKAIASVPLLAPYLLYIYICCTQLIFTAVYVFLRYFFDPDFDFIGFFKGLAGSLLISIIGKETSKYIGLLR